MRNGYSIANSGTIVSYSVMKADSRKGLTRVMYSEK
ncbi:MAG: hypothetical protein KatS3mg023_3843 [Armatimonadota bacterium]|nr:MAG: hypothetical protein KatS3mg023_2257 [Armatimonadota bacterium]GIV22092.1 MAG: hypothetical protein KatS3mg023_3843 [Armatimonadota bacterium]